MYTGEGTEARQQQQQQQLPVEATEEAAAEIPRPISASFFRISDVDIMNLEVIVDDKAAGFSFDSSETSEIEIFDLIDHDYCCVSSPSSGDHRDEPIPKDDDEKENENTKPCDLGLFRNFGNQDEIVTAANCRQQQQQLETQCLSRSSSSSFSSADSSCDSGYSQRFDSFMSESDDDPMLEVSISSSSEEPGSPCTCSHCTLQFRLAPVLQSRKRLYASLADSTDDAAADRVGAASGKPAKKKFKARVNKDLLLSDENEILAGKDSTAKRVTRLELKRFVDGKSGADAIDVKPIDCSPGRLVWGWFSRRWWPAIIIKAEDAGMFTTSDKVWLFWLGESKISELSRDSIQVFSSQLEKRLDDLLPKSKKEETMNKQKEKVCFKTIELIKRQNWVGKGPLTKPYAKWLLDHATSPEQKQNLDEVRFHPYPQDIMEKLDGYKKLNDVKTKKYLKSLEKEKIKKQSKVEPIPKIVKPSPEPVRLGGIDIVDQQPGLIVWAKLQGFNWWPCTVVDYQDILRRQPYVAHQWVLWYSDFQVSQVEYTSIINFTAGLDLMRSKIESDKDESFSRAVVQAAQDFCKQSRPIVIKNIDDVKQVFYQSKDVFPSFKSADSTDVIARYPPIIQEQVKKIRKNLPAGTRRKAIIDKFGKIDSVIKGEIPLNTICMSCFDEGELKEHPFFMAYLCQECWDDLTPLMFAYGNDNKCFFCTLCGGDDTVAVCDEIDCPRVFCTACIKYVITPSQYEKIMNTSPWKCFICDPDQLNQSKSKNLIQVRRKWQDSLRSIYCRNFGDNQSLKFKLFDFNRKIRVLSLFDGIATGFQVLKNLGIQVEVYYASEICDKAMAVSFFNHGNDIIQLGDVRLIDEKKLKEIAPIDLLIGGSPCNELSLANPKRRGLDDPEGTGVLFYEYVRILETLKKLNKKRHLFWLFENVASMPKKYSNKISQKFGRQPMFLDSADFSAQHRPRLYWGNLPCTVFEKKNVYLQDMLHPNCGRQALAKKVMTITTRTTSLNQTKENLKVVQMGAIRDTLWVTEVENIFGLPTHYTDANVSTTNRLKLLGKAWSVQTIEAIFRSLMYFCNPKKE